MNFRKGQGASEYLVLLAVVLIVAMVALVLLGGFTEIGGTARETEAKSYWSGPVRPFNIPDYAQRGTTFSLTIHNTEVYKLILKNITVGTDTFNLSAPYGYTFKGGATKTITFNVSRNCSTNDFDFYDYNLTLHYDTVKLQNLMQSGSKALSGTCYVQ